MRKNSFLQSLSPEEVERLIAACIFLVSGFLYVSSAFRFPGSLDMYARLCFSSVMVIWPSFYISLKWRRYRNNTQKQKGG